MTNSEKNSTLSHEAHERHHQDNYSKGIDYLSSRRNTDCVSYKISIQYLDPLLPLLKEKNSWLTIGDFTGFEAQYLTEHNQNATASDISDVFLKDAYEQKLIENYKKINVEQIDCDEDSFDYLLCKESFHHFPRAYLGLYEMIRVAKKGAILVEPVDVLSKMPLLLYLKNICDLFNPHLINKFWKNRFSWEVVGNYVFKISEREVEKIAMGMGLSCIAFKEMNIRLAPIPEKWGDSNKTPMDTKLYKKLKRKFSIWNLICKLRIIPYNTSCAIIFKEKPSVELIQDLKKNNYRVIELPANPYLS